MSNIKQQIVEIDNNSMDEFDLTLLNNSFQPSSPSDEINNRVRYDYNTLESFYEIDVTDFNMSLYSDQFFKDILDDFKTLEQSIARRPTLDEINELFPGETEVYQSTESNDMADLIQSADEELAMMKSNDSALPSIRSLNGKLPTKNGFHQPISLSKSVAVTVPTPNQLQLVHPLEDTFRARYKSDYFPQSGAVRRPRYVADNSGNHFVTLQMPTEYTQVYTNEYVRVALITTPINGRGRFYSPYKFQTNHNDVKVPDQNPIYLPVQVHQGNNFTIKLHLVLIKSKLDQLYNAQPLKPFCDTIGYVQNIINEEKLASKDLINKYQLDKSHIAFTLCTKLSNGSYDIHPETTIISTVITEVPTKQTAASNNKSESISTNSRKKICCPKCAHCFNPTDADIPERVPKRKPYDSTSRTVSKSVTNNRTNKKKKTV